MISRNGEQPCRKLGLSLKGLEVLICLGKNFLREIGGRLTIIHKAKAPSCHARVVPSKELVNTKLALVGISSLSIADRKCLVGDVVEGYLANYSNAPEPVTG